MKVVFSLGSARDLEDIADHISKDNPRRARSFVAELRQAALELSASPLIHPSASFDARIRRAVHGSCNIYYAVLPAELRILAIVHGSRAHDAVLFDLVRR
ncbi:type II toxin-antitoxin system RelE/ParE family toxin [Brevundimonas sp. PAMC22021]|uniref:type II toxin-antitoxin system RelE/ParE family toxin n=1 Tax=Brevundimonas sp. PAMC22021 TaxID=2861285 RepID=UPI001C627235|nr:type II toxin-antitoxin system RelE/ParE family toxin [Brevundimonas sp. PAMC22021]QYF86644.1 type II toxin-antitoxin system RelE/ParE family toxin [Brevundimonas sp. PAMC22021]